MVTKKNAAVKAIIGKKTVAAAANTITRLNTSTKAGGFADFDKINRFRYYQQLAGCTPHASMSLNKLGLSLIKGMEFDGDQATVAALKLWSRKTKFTEQLQSLARLLCRDGTYLALPRGKTAETYQLRPFLMAYTTILGQGDIIQPDISKIMLNEGSKGTEQSYNQEEVIYGTYNAWDSVFCDIKGRETFGIYGASLMEPIELSITNLLDLNSGYVAFVKKYGLGRYIFDFKLLEKLVEAGLMTYEDAQASIDAFLEKHKNLSENEDITSMGLSVSPIDAKGSLEVQAFKDSLEAEIQIGLLQSPLTMGKSSGSTYASSYMVEEDRMLVMEGLQHTVEDMAQDVINRLLVIMKKNPDSVTIQFEELSRVKIDAGAMQEMYNTGVISKKSFQTWAGFPDEVEV